MSSVTQFDWQPLTALVPFSQAIQGMLEVADRDWKDLMESKAHPGSVSPTVLQRMLDRHLQHQSHLGVYQAQCARWRQETLTPQQAGILTKLEGYLGHLKDGNAQIMKWLMSLQSGAQMSTPH